MLYMIFIATALYAGLTALNKLEEKEELKKAEEEGYEVMFVS